MGIQKLAFMSKLPYLCLWKYRMSLFKMFNPKPLSLGINLYLNPVSNQCRTIFLIGRSRGDIINIKLCGDLHNEI